MDTAFINRVGVTRGWQYGELQFYPDGTGKGRVKRIAPFVWVTEARDRMQGGTERFVLPGIRFNFARQGYLRVDFGRGHENICWPAFYDRAGARGRRRSIQFNRQFLMRLIVHARGPRPLFQSVVSGALLTEPFG
jgi:hypothetical protein